jgi:hypothetical protein
VHDHFLLTSQRDEVFRAVREEGLDPAEFEWRKQPSSVTVDTISWQTINVPYLVHLPTGSYFVFDFSEKTGYHHARYGPGTDRPEDGLEGGHWGDQMSCVHEWLRNVERERRAPDLWGELRRHQQLSAPPQPSDENSPFTDDERRLITQQLSELKELLVTAHALDAERARDLEARLDYLDEATARLGRFDWKQILVAELVGLVMRAVIPNAAFEASVHFLTRTIGHLFGGAVPELPVA